MRTSLFTAALFLLACSSEPGSPDSGIIPTQCQPGDCSPYGRECGYYTPMGGTCLDCGDCAAPMTCGGAGMAGRCGCRPATCEEGVSCGTLVDACGGAPIECGACVAPETCGGAGTPNVCGAVAGLGGRCGERTRCASGQCCARGNGMVCATPDAQGNCPLANGPDLVVDRPTAEASVTFEDLTVPADYCAIDDGCLPGPGTYRLLRFSTMIGNAGTEDVVIGDPDTTPGFVFAQCHAHYHYGDYVEYRLKDSTGQVLRSGFKAGFCVEDTLRLDPNADPDPIYFCDQAISGVQGIQKGWGDLYLANLDCQWVDVTGVVPGNYVLEVEVNPARKTPEVDFDNNVAAVPVIIR